MASHPDLDAGAFAPVSDEVTLTSLEVEGEIPRELCSWRRVPAGFHGGWIAES